MPNSKANNMRNQCNNCPKYINQKVFENYSGLCMKCYFISNPAKNVKKEMQKEKTKTKNYNKKMKEYASQDLSFNDEYW